MVLNKKLTIPSVRELFQSLPTIRKDWILKTPLQKWCYFYGVGKAACKITAVPIFEEDQTLSLWAYQLPVYIGINLVLVVYTVYYHLILGEMTKCLPCTCILTVLLASSTYYFESISRQRYMIHRGSIFSGRYILRDDYKDIEYTEICSKFMDNSVKSVMIRIIITSLCFVAMTVGPSYAFFIQDIRVTALDVRVPFTNEKSTEEFIGNLIVQMIIFAYGAPALVAMEIAMEIFLGVAVIEPKLVAYEFRKLDKRVEKNLLTKMQIRMTFRNIVQQIMDVDDFKISTCEIVFWRDLLTPPLFTYGIGMSIFCQYTMGFVAGYGIALLCYVQLFFMCNAGETFQDNGMGDVIYNSTWYALPIEQQKDVMHLINRTQNGVNISIGPFATLNNECCYVITSKIYSFVMFLLNFFE